MHSGNRETGSVKHAVECLPSRTEASAVSRPFFFSLSLPIKAKIVNFTGSKK
jgi:hypothetical protein